MPDLGCRQDADALSDVEGTSSAVSYVSKVRWLGFRKEGPPDSCCHSYRNGWRQKINSRKSRTRTTVSGSRRHTSNNPQSERYSRDDTGSSRYIETVGIYEKVNNNSHL